MTVDVDIDGCYSTSASSAASFCATTLLIHSSAYRQIRVLVNDMAHRAPSNANRTLALFIPSTASFRSGSQLCLDSAPPVCPKETSSCPRHFRLYFVCAFSIESNANRLSAAQQSIRLPPNPTLPFCAFACRQSAVGGDYVN